MLSKQYHLATKQTGHAIFSIPYTEPSRIMKKSLATLYEDDISHLFSQEGNTAAQHKTGLIAIHTESVENHITKLEPNKVLGVTAPEIDKSERKLPRSTRRTLAQLRAGYSPYLKQYLHRINPTMYGPECPKCNLTPHDTHHLFNCPGNHHQTIADYLPKSG